MRLVSILLSSSVSWAVFIKEQNYHGRDSTEDDPKNVSEYEPPLKRLTHEAFGSSRSTAIPETSDSEIGNDQVVKRENKDAKVSPKKPIKKNTPVVKASLEKAKEEDYNYLNYTFAKCKEKLDQLWESLRNKTEADLEVASLRSEFRTQKQVFDHAVKVMNSLDWSKIADYGKLKKMELNTIRYFKKAEWKFTPTGSE